MAESKENIITRGLSGTIARMLTFRQRAGKTIVSKFLRPTIIPPSERLVSVRAKFASSIAYAKMAIKNPAIKALYQVAATGGQTAFNRATADALHVPKLTNIHLGSYHGDPGDGIIIEATDDFKVTGVTVSIQQASGDLIEQGNAIMQENTTDWIYTALKLNTVLAGSKITAVAMDLPGNRTSFSKTLI
jgi:hypothetical protein